MKQFLLILLFASSLFSAELTLTTADGFKLYGWLDKPATVTKPMPIILFAHQFGADHSTWDTLAKKFNAKGYATLSVDLRGHGKSIMQNNKENKVITDTKLDHIKEAIVQSDKKSRL
jgi:alpha-beta hydrolase superfamily lysophospholipase